MYIRVRDPVCGRFYFIFILQYQLVAFGFLALTSGAPQRFGGGAIPILSQTQEVNPDGSYQYR